MAIVTIIFGLLLAGIAWAGHVEYGTGLHALWFGVVLVLCGLLSLGDSPRRRMIFMHIAVTVGLLGFLVPGTMSTVALVKSHSGGAPMEQAAAVHEQMLVALLCLVYTVLCVRSFIAARRARNT